MRLNLVMESLYFPLNPKIQNDKTRYQYRIAMRDFRAALKREPDTRDLTDDSIALMVTHLQRKGLSHRTINERRGRINTLWAWLAKRGQKKHWPGIAPLRVPVRIPKAWDRRELETLFGFLSKLKRRIWKIPEREWWTTLQLVSWETGERIGALLAARWEHLSGEWLTLPAEIRKGRHHDRTYRLTKETLAAIEAIRYPPRELIWPWPYCETYLWIRYKKIRQRAGLATDRMSSFHRMRKSTASHAAAAGGNAQEILGHNNAAVTKKYIDPRITNQPQAIDFLFRPGG